jgi:hypothetical protein
MPPPAAVSGGSLYGRLLGYPNKFQGEVWSKLSSASASPSNSLNQRHRCRRCGRLRQPVVGALSFVGVAEFGRVVDPAFPGGHIRLFRCCWRWRFCRRVCRIRYTGVLFNRHPYCCACPTGKPIQRAAGCVSQLCKHKQYIDKYGEDMPEIRNWQWSTPNTSLLVTALVLLKFAVIRTRNQDEDYPSGAG